MSLTPPFISYLRLIKAGPFKRKAILSKLSKICKISVIMGDACMIKYLNNDS